jgi:malate synthase
VGVGLKYLVSWLRGNGAAAINNVMEEAATAEIWGAQIWQWIRHRLTTDDGTPVTPARYRSMRAEELAKLGGPSTGRLGDAATILDELVESGEFVSFLTLPAYRYLD